MAEPAPRATVVILTFNGAVYLREILEAVFRQRFDGVFEVLVIDSGSTDSTLEILAQFPEVRLHQIPNSEFGHGRTRNLAATLARGEFVAFLTHDAIPLTDRWLHHMIDPFELGPQLVAVVGRQVPRPRCIPVMKYEINASFARYGPEHSVHVSQRGDFDFTEHPALLDMLGFYSDVNSAARRHFLVSVMPYRDVRYAEDQLFGRELLLAGYRKAYAPQGAVLHSNDVTFAEYGLRIFDETVGLREVGFTVPRLTRWQLAKYATRGMLADSRRILHDPTIGRKRKPYWWIMNPAYHLQKWRAYAAASSIDLDDSESIGARSLEYRRKRSASDASGG